MNYNIKTFTIYLIPLIIVISLQLQVSCENQLHLDDCFLI